MPADTRRKWSESGSVEVVASPSNKGNGMTLDASGRLLACEHVTSAVARIDPSGTGEGRDVIASHYQGKELNSPNDVVVKSDGSIYFSDPTYGRMPGFGLERDHGRVFAENVGTGSLEKMDLVDGMKCDERGNIWVTGPEGIWIFSADGEHLGVVKIPEPVGNLTFGGPEWKWLFLTASTGLYRVQTKVAAHREPYMR